MPTHLRFVLRFGAVCLMLAFGTVLQTISAQNAAPPSRAFDIPAGTADRSLKLLATQAGVEVLFSTTAVGSVKTNAVKGEFTTRAAVDRLLAGTPLVAVTEPTTGALRISPGAPPNVARATPAPADARPSPQPQVTPSANEVVVLSPFTVASEQDTGYQATTTLAGTRVRTELANVATSVTVLTKDFLNDVGATDARDLFLYVASTEVTGFGGNLSGAGRGFRGFSESGFVSDKTNIRVRGLATADNLRNYFGTEIPFDSYNIERVEVNRGANASLFGLGSPAGVINTSLIEAEFRDRLTIEARGGSYGSLRGSFDVNKVLVSDTVALRIAGVHDRRRFQQDPAFEDVSRIFGTATMQKKLLRNSAVLGRTRLRVNYEEGLNNANRPRTLPPLDRITSWFNPYNFGTTTIAPKPTWNGATDIAVLRQGRELDLISGFFRSGTAIYPSPSANAPEDAFGSGVQARQGVVSNVPNPNGAPFTGVFVVPIPMTVALALANVPGNSLYASPLLSDASIFDFRNQLLDGPNKSERSSFDAASFALEQLLFERGGFEYAYDKQRTRLASRRLIGSDAVYAINIDANTVLVDGTPNSNFGRPVIGGPGAISRGETEGTTHRLTAYYDLDFASLVNGRAARWLGRHVLTGLYSSSTSDSFSANGQLNYLGLEYAHGSGNNVTNGDQRLAGSITYLGPSLANANTATGANLSRITAEQWPPETLVVRGKAPAAGVPFSNQTVNVFEGVWTTGNRTRQEVDSRALVWQSYLLDKLLVGTVSWRRDEFESFTAGAPPVTFDGNRLVRDPSWMISTTPDLAVKDNTFSYGGVLHAPSSWLQRVPGLSGLSGRYNESENFSPSAVRFTVLGQAIPPQAGETRDVGISFSALDQRLTFNVTRYETTQSNADSTIGPGVTTLVNQFGRAHQEHLRANRPFGPGGRPLNAAGEELPNLPDQFLSIYGFNWNPNSGPIGQVTFGNPNIGGLTDFIAKGWEFEGVWNATKRWRVAFNAAKQQSVRSNTMSDQLAFFTQPLLTRTNGQTISLLDAWTGPWASLQTNEGGNESLGWAAGRFRDELAAARAQDGGSAQELREWRFNVITNYSFEGGRLKGFNIGGAYRWQDAAAIGFPLVTGPAGVLTTDVTRPIYGPRETHVDAWIGYKRRIWRDRVEWRLQLNVRNVFGNDDLVPVAANPDGQISAWQIPLERSWELTSTLRF